MPRFARLGARRPSRRRADVSAAHGAGLDDHRIRRPPEHDRRREHPRQRSRWRIDAIPNGFDQTLSRAEYLWETLDRNGMNSIVLQYPGTWPPREGGFVQVDGAGGYADIGCDSPQARRARSSATPRRRRMSRSVSSFRRLCRALAPPRRRQRHAARNRARAKQVERAAARGAAGVRGRAARARARPSRGAHDVRPCCARAPDTFLVLSPNRDGADSEAYSCAAATGATGSAAGAGAAASLTASSSSISTPRRAGCICTSAKATGWKASPAPSTWADLLRELGPVAEWAGTFDFFNGLVDLDTQLEIYEQHTDWLAARSGLSRAAIRGTVSSRIGTSSSTRIISSEPGSTPIIRCTDRRTPSAT